VLLRSSVALQFRLTPDNVTRTIDQLWVLGYCFGVLDAVRQTAELEEPGEGVALIAVGFFLLMADEAKGADMMRQALNHESDPRFAQGSLQGGNDMFAWLADTAKAPTGLSKHVNSPPRRTKLDVRSRSSGATLTRNNRDFTKSDGTLLKPTSLAQLACHEQNGRGRPERSESRC
jgi:hypothetical protein